MDRRTNETTRVSFIAYSTSGVFRAEGFCLELRAEIREHARKAARRQREGGKVGGREEVTRAIGLRKESVLPRDFRISLRGGFIGFVSSGNSRG